MWKSVVVGSCAHGVSVCSTGGFSGQRFGNGKCWMSSDYGSTVTQSNAKCPSGWSLPSQSDFNSLISSSQAGSGACLYEQGWSGRYWSSTYTGDLDGYGYYSLYVVNQGAYIGSYSSRYDILVRCVSS